MCYTMFAKVQPMQT